MQKCSIYVDGADYSLYQLPSSVMEYKGTWDASTNTPTLVDGTGDTGDTYAVSVAGSQDLGSGSIDFEVGDYIIYNGSVWEKLAGGGAGGVEWEEVTGTTKSAEVNYGYITNNASQVVVTLPTTADVGSVIRIAGKGAGGWKLAQNASQQIIFGTQTTTSGVTGYLESNDDADAVEIVCITANNIWVVISSIGNITYV